MEKKNKHLEFIQNVITRMNYNSFLIKGWTITLVSAIFVLASKESKLGIIKISYMIILIFWILDGYFISMERKFRELYKTVIQKNESDIDFSMEVSQYNQLKQSWLCGIFSNTLLLFYLIFLFASIVVMKNM